MPNNGAYHHGMEIFTPPIHLAIASYDQGPPPAEPLMISLCITGRIEGERVTEDIREVTCLRCRGHMLRLGMRPPAGE